MALSDINNLLAAIWEVIRDRIPALSNGKIPVDVSSLNITLNDASLEISNDVGNPVPVSGTVTANTGLSQPLTDTQLRANAVPVSMTAVPPGLAYLSTATITRSANTTAYTANDVYGNGSGGNAFEL
ncbi:MAG: hypothetical protein ACKPEQ_38910, partial [Dolichospermum sp.]